MLKWFVYERKFTPLSENCHFWQSQVFRFFFKSSWEHCKKTTTKEALRVIDFSRLRRRLNSSNPPKFAVEKELATRVPSRNRPVNCRKSSLERKVLTRTKWRRCILHNSWEKKMIDDRHRRSFGTMGLLNFAKIHFGTISAYLEFQWTIFINGHKGYFEIATDFSN